MMLAFFALLSCVALTSGYAVNECIRRCSPNDEHCWSKCRLFTDRPFPPIPVTPTPNTSGKCFSDEECTRGFSCEDGACVCLEKIAVRGGKVYCTPETCTSNEECPGAQKCSDEVCEDVSCTNNLGCLVDELCLSGICVQNLCIPGCRADERCFRGLCKPIRLCGAHQDCYLDEKCVSTLCTPLDQFDQCDNARPCGKPQEICLHGACAYACQKRGDCGPGQDCVGHICQKLVQCYASTDCLPTEVCEDGLCVPPVAACATTEDCDDGYVCYRGECRMTCNLRLQCPAGFRCDGGLCSDQAACTSFRDCESKICWNNRCVQCAIDLDCAPDGSQKCIANVCALPFVPEVAD